MAVDYDTLSNQAKAAGDAAIAYYNAMASDYTNQYNSSRDAANQANTDIQNFNDYMKNAGSATNLYNNALTAQQAQTGYNQQQLQAAMGNLSNAQGSLSAYNDFANTAASKWGLNAGGLAAANAVAQGAINNNIAAASQSLKNQQDAFQLAQTGANQQAGLGLQQQQVQLAGYKQVYDNALAQQQVAADMIKFYQDAAQKQGGLTASQVQSYQTAKQAAASAQAALAQAAYAMSQTAGQNLQNATNQKYVDWLNTGNNASNLYNSQLGSTSSTPQTTSSQQQNTNQQPGLFSNSLSNIAKGTANWIGQGGFVGDVGRYINGLFR